MYSLLNEERFGATKSFPTTYYILAISMALSLALQQDIDIPTFLMACEALPHDWTITFADTFQQTNTDVGNPSFVANFRDLKSLFFMLLQEFVSELESMPIFYMASDPSIVLFLQFESPVFPIFFGMLMQAE